VTDETDNSKAELKRPPGISLGTDILFATAIVMSGALAIFAGQTLTKGNFFQSICSMYGCFLIGWIIKIFDPDKIGLDREFTILHYIWLIPAYVAGVCLSLNFNSRELEYYVIQIPPVIVLVAIIVAVRRSIPLGPFFGSWKIAITSAVLIGATFYFVTRWIQVP
jgi:hypothetical protein